MEGKEDLRGRAFIIAFDAHKGQVDKSGAAYIAHVARVASGVEHHDAVVVALLHDVVEDTDVQLDELRSDFPSRIVDAVDAITRRAGEHHEDYYERVKANSLAHEVKLADIADNSSSARLSFLDAETRTRLEEKYAKALAQLGSENRHDENA